MKKLPAPSLAATPQPSTSRARGAPRSGQLAVWQLNLMRVGYVVMVVGLAVKKWPLLLDHGGWGLAEGTKDCLLIAMSFLALLGLRYPQRMLPVLLFEVIWKLLWLGVVALPLWTSDKLEGATRTQTGAILWVVVLVWLLACLGLTWRNYRRAARGGPRT